MKRNHLHKKYVRKFESCGAFIRGNPFERRRPHPHSRFGTPLESRPLAAGGKKTGAVLEYMYVDKETGRLPEGELKRLTIPV